MGQNNSLWLWRVLTVGTAVMTLFASPSSSAQSNQSLKGKTLVIASWGGVWTELSKKYFGDPFSADTGVKVTYIESGNGFAPQSIAQEQSGNVQWDILDGAGSDAYVLESKGYLEHFPRSLIDAIKPLVRSDQLTTTFTLDYGDTATLIACNPAIMKKCPTNPKEFWDVENFPGPRAILNNAETAMMFALQADGIPPAKVFPMDIDRAIKKLEQIKPHVRVWPASGAQQQQVMIDAEVGVSLMWNGRAWTVKKQNLPDLQMNWDGATVGAGGLAVLKNAPNKDVAFAYIKWFAEHPDKQAGWTSEITYPTPTTKLLDLVLADVAAALPAAHKPLKEDTAWIVAHKTETQKAWRQFLTGR